MTYSKCTMIICAALLVATAAGCGGAQKPELTDDGIPVWVDAPCFELAETSLCAVGSSDMVRADEEAGKTDAEMAAKNRIQEQLEANVKRLQERQITAMKELGTGEIVGSKTLRDINQNYVEGSLVGLRYTEYFYMPERLNPEKVWVRAVLDVDHIALSQQITEAMLAAVKKAVDEEKLEMDHVQAQLRLEKVRAQYLKEQGVEATE